MIAKNSIFMRFKLILVFVPNGNTMLFNGPVPTKGMKIEESADSLPSLNK